MRVHVSTNGTGVRIQRAAPLFVKGDTQEQQESSAFRVWRGLRVHSSCNLALDSWQVNGYVVNLFWSFDTHRQEKRTLNFRGTVLSQKGSVPELVGV